VNGLFANAHAIAVLAFTIVAFFLFTRERIPIPVTSLIVIVGGMATTIGTSTSSSSCR
jgi:hypothetical protein